MSAPPTIFITIGHAHSGESAGASYEGFQEVAMIRGYVAAMQSRLQSFGWRVLIGDKARYSADKTAADAAGAIVYVNAHVNAGMGGKDSQRGEIFYDYRTSNRNGIALATEIARRLDDVFPWEVQAKRCRPDTNGVPRDGDYSEAFGCISGVMAVAVCTEPFFLDGADRAALRSPAGLVQIGTLIADGIAAWYRARV